MKPGNRRLIRTVLILAETIMFLRDERGDGFFTEHTTFSQRQRGSFSCSSGHTA